MAPVHRAETSPPLTLMVLSCGIVSGGAVRAGILGSGVAAGLGVAGGGATEGDGIASGVAVGIVSGVDVGVAEGVGVAAVFLG